MKKVALCVRRVGMRSGDVLRGLGRDGGKEAAREGARSGNPTSKCVWPTFEWSFIDVREREMRGAGL